MSLQGSHAGFWGLLRPGKKRKIGPEVKFSNYEDHVRPRVTIYIWGFVRGTGLIIVYMGFCCRYLNGGAILPLASGWR